MKILIKKSDLTEEQLAKLSDMAKFLRALIMVKNKFVGNIPDMYSVFLWEYECNVMVRKVAERIICFDDMPPHATAEFTEDESNTLDIALDWYDQYLDNGYVEPVVPVSPPPKKKSFTFWKPSV